MEVDKHQALPDPWEDNFLSDQNTVLTPGIYAEAPVDRGWSVFLDKEEAEETAKMFSQVFSEFWTKENCEDMESMHLMELPGAALDNVDFLELLTNKGVNTFLMEGNWNSPYGRVPWVVRYALYHGEDWAKYWVSCLIMMYEFTPFEIRCSGQMN